METDNYRYVDLSSCKKVRLKKDVVTGARVDLERIHKAGSIFCIADTNISGLFKTLVLRNTSGIMINGIFNSDVESV